MKRFHFSILMIFIYVFTLLSSCKKDIVEENFTYKTIFKSEFAGTYAIPKQQIVIKSDAEWKALISRMTISSFTEVEIDFSKYTIIAVFDEVKNSGGFEVEITDVTENSDNIFIKVDYRRNTLGGAVTAALTLPCHIIKIKKTGKTIVFN